MTALIDVAATTLDRPPSLDDRRLFGHPRGLGLLFVVEMWERFSYYGMRALLILYMVNYLHWGVASAAKLYGTYTSLVYLTPLIGGYVADRFIGTRRALIVGGVVIALGHFSLAFESMPTFYLGLALIIIGTGFFKPNVSTMVGQLYPPGDSRRDSGFTIFYMGINLGAALAPLVCGWLAHDAGWRYGFAAAGVGMVMGLIIYIWGVNRYLPEIGIISSRGTIHTSSDASAGSDMQKESVMVIPSVVGAALGGIIALLLHGGWMGGFFGITIGTMLGMTLGGTHGEERKHVIAIFIAIVFVICFWMAAEQTGSSMILFADKHTQRQIGHWTIPPSFFQSINPVFILLLAPIFAWIWTRLEMLGRSPSTAWKMAFSLVLLGCGFGLLAFGAHYADAGMKVSPLWLVGAYFLHTCGELCLSPVGLSYVTKIAPIRFASLLMGAWFLGNATASWLAGNFAALTATMAHDQAKFFTIFIITSFVAATLGFLAVPFLKRLTNGEQ
jgi:POT family proton-dependent oligopeptide transporter